jgi:uncharacterized protein YndB with AHSA1/START domain
MSAHTIKITMNEDRTVRMTREFAAPPRLVWDAHTKPELAKQWLGGFDGWSMKTCTIDLRVGGKARYVMLHAESGQEMGWSDTFTEVDPHACLSFTELFDEDWTGGETLNTCLFKEHAPGRTLLEMTILYSSNEAREEALKINFVEGMELSYARMDALIASGSAALT